MQHNGAEVRNQNPLRFGGRFSIAGIVVLNSPAYTERLLALKRILHPPSLSSVHKILSMHVLRHKSSSTFHGLKISHGPDGLRSRSQDRSGREAKGCLSCIQIDTLLEFQHEVLQIALAFGEKLLNM